MDLKEIRKIVELMDEHGLSLFHLEKDDFNLKLKKGTDVEAIRQALAGLSFAAPAPAFPAAGTGMPTSAPEEPADNGRSITSPMVGTFYRKAAPDAEPFVNVGDVISEGQTLCIIEAMKVMNEIKADANGIVTEVSVEDSTPVQYGDVLFRLK